MEEYEREGRRFPRYDCWKLLNLLIWTPTTPFFAMLWQTANQDRTCHLGICPGDARFTRWGPCQSGRLTPNQEQHVFSIRYITYPSQTATTLSLAQYIGFECTYTPASIMINLPWPCSNTLCTNRCGHDQYFALCTHLLSCWMFPESRLCTWRSLQ